MTPTQLFRYSRRPQVWGPLDRAEGRRSEERRVRRPVQLDAPQASFVQSRRQRCSAYSSSLSWKNPRNLRRGPHRHELRRIGARLLVIACIARLPLFPSSLGNLGVGSDHRALVQRCHPSNDATAFRRVKRRGVLAVPSRTRLGDDLEGRVSNVVVLQVLCRAEQEAIQRIHRSGRLGPLSARTTACARGRVAVADPFEDLLMIRVEVRVDCGADVAVALSYASLLNTRTACLYEGLELWYATQRALFILRLLWHCFA